MDYHRQKLERIFRAKFDDIVGPRMGIPQDGLILFVPIDLAQKALVLGSLP